MSDLPLDALAVEDTPCGRVRLRLSAEVSWHEFPDFAERLMGAWDGTVIQRADSEEIRVWRVRTESSEVSLVFEDHPPRVFLESTDGRGDQALRALHRRLRQA